jgi:hypothetical protein
MPYLICPECRTTVYSAAGHSSTERCTEYDHALAGAERSPEHLRRWRLFDLPRRPIAGEARSEAD